MTSSYGTSLPSFEMEIDAVAAVGVGHGRIDENLLYGGEDGIVRAKTVSGAGADA